MSFSLVRSGNVATTTQCRFTRAQFICEFRPVSSQTRLNNRSMPSRDDPPPPTRPRRATAAVPWRGGPHHPSRRCASGRSRFGSQRRRRPTPPSSLLGPDVAASGADEAADRGRAPRSARSRGWHGGPPRVASTHATALAGATAAPERPRPWRVATIGAAWTQRLQRPARRAQARPRARRAATPRAWPTPTHAVRISRASSVHAPILRDDALGVLQSIAKARGARRSASCTDMRPRRHAKPSTARRLAAAASRRTIAPLAAWLQSLTPSPWRRARTPASAPLDPGGPSVPPSPRRYDRARWPTSRGLSSTIACECRARSGAARAALGLRALQRRVCERSPRTKRCIAISRESRARPALFESALERVAVAGDSSCAAAAPTGPR